MISVVRSLAAIPLWALLLVLLGGVVAWSSLDVGFLSDDFLMTRYWDRDLLSVRWDRVALDFQGPWFGAVRDLYRPVVSLSCALQLAVHGFDPRWFHLANAAMVTIAALAIGALVRLRFPHGRGLLAFCAGAVLLVHPAVVEPSHWILSRTTALEGMFGALTMLCYGAFLHGRLRSRWPAFVTMALALGSKEGALLLPVSLVAVDVLMARGSLRARVQGLRPFFVLLAAALCFRKLALGWFTTAKDSLGPMEVLDGVATHAGWLLGPSGMVQMLTGAMLAVLVIPWAWQRPRLALAFVLWITLSLLPASHVTSVEGTYDGRLIWSMLPALALLLAEAAAAARWPRFAGGLACAMLAVFAASAWPFAAAYQTGGAAVAALQRGTASAAAARSNGAPLAVAAVGLPDLRLQLMLSRLWGLLALRPFAAQDGAIVSLDSILPINNQLPKDVVDGSPAAAVLAAGGAVGDWRHASAQCVTATRPALPEEAREVLPVAGAVGVFRSRIPCPALAASVLEVELPEPSVHVELQLAVDLPEPVAFGVRVSQTAKAQRTHWFDVSLPRTALVLHGIGQPWPDLRITSDGAPAPAGTKVRWRDDPTLLTMPKLAGKSIALDQLERSLPLPERDATLYLLLPTTTLQVSYVNGQPLRLTDAARRELEFAHSLLGRFVMHAFWRADAGREAPMRSPLDWMVVH
jgi:hypothetical protein